MTGLPHAKKYDKPFRYVTDRIPLWFINIVRQHSALLRWWHAIKNVTAFRQEDAKLFDASAAAAACVYVMGEECSFSRPAGRADDSMFHRTTGQTQHYPSTAGLVCCPVRIAHAGTRCYFITFDRKCIILHC